MDGKSLPEIITEIPGPRSRDWVERLSKTESPAITARRARRESETGVPQDPIVWDSALGANVMDVDGNRYVDLTAAFAVCGLGHRHPRVVEAARKQSDRLIHAMGDVYPSDVKIAFCERLAELTPGDLEQSILGMAGADSITAALKTAVMHTGKTGVISFWGGYHGLSYGALAPTGYRRSFREPFLGQLNPNVNFVPFPDPYRPPFGMSFDSEPADIRDAVLAYIRSMLENPASGVANVGAILVEPIQGRGGEIVPPAGFLSGLREIANEFGLVLIFDEIFTGFARTGRPFACEWEAVIPDIMCLGKAMGGGFPLSAAIGRPEIMASWGLSSGEAIHTSTFLGNPLGCAMGLAALDAIFDESWADKNDRRGQAMINDLHGLQALYPEVIGDVRGRGLMIGVDFVRDSTSREPDGALGIALMDGLRRDGYLVLPSGVHGNVLGLSPPFVLSAEQWDGFMAALKKQVEKASANR